MTNKTARAGNSLLPWQFPSLNTTFSKPTTKQCFLQCFCCLSCFSAAVTKENLLKTPAIVSLANFQILLRHPRLAFDWLSVSFFVYWSPYFSLQDVQTYNGSSRNLKPSHTTRDAFMNKSLAFSRYVSLGRLWCHPPGVKYAFIKGK